jgi:4-azaleucine resistance transporter AzlC
MAARSEFLAGVKAELPILLGVVPFGLLYGVLALSAGLTPLAAQAMSAIIFAGSAQIVSAQLFGVAAPAVVICLTGFMLNLRHVLYSASIAPHLKPLPARWKWLLAYLLTDEAYIVAILHYDRPGPAGRRHWYFLGAGLALWATWQVSTAAGIALGAQAPEDWSLDFAVPLTFIALVVPVLRDRPAIVAALTAGIAAVLLAGLPLKLGLVAATLAGMVAAVVTDRSRGARRPEAAD